MEQVIFDASFLPQINKLSLRNSVISNSGSLKSLKDYNDKYILWKRKVLQELEHVDRLLDMNQAFLACAKCHYKICDIRKVDKEAELGWLRRLNTSGFALVKQSYNPSVSTLAPPCNDSFRLG